MLEVMGQLRCLAVTVLLMLPALGAVKALPNNQDFGAAQANDPQEPPSDLEGGLQKLGKACEAMQCRQSGKPNCPEAPNDITASQKLCDDLTAMMGQAVKLNDHKTLNCEGGMPPKGSRDLGSMAWDAIKSVLPGELPWPLSLVNDLVNDLMGTVVSDVVNDVVAGEEESSGESE